MLNYMRARVCTRAHTRALQAHTQRSHSHASAYKGPVFLYGRFLSLIGNSNALSNHLRRYIPLSALIASRSTFLHIIHSQYSYVYFRKVVYLFILFLSCRFDEYREAFIRELCHVKIRHWDASQRELAAECIGRIAPLQPALLMTADLFPDMVIKGCVAEDSRVRHGSLMTCARVITSLQACGQLAVVPAVTLTHVRAIRFYLFICLLAYYVFILFIRLLLWCQTSSVHGFFEERIQSSFALLSCSLCAL